MQRPVMNPSYLDDRTSAVAVPGERPDWRRLARAVLRPLWRAARAFVVLLLSRPLAGVRSATVRDETGTPLGRFMRGLAYRLAFLPVILAGLAALLVYFGTHPGQSAIVKDPITFGTYYDAVSFTSSDARRLDAWLVPVLDAKKVVEQRDLALRSKWPAVVLVHDYGQTRQDVLPLVRPLHEAGYVVMVTTLRGQDGGAGGHTFGLKESDDVVAAVELLRRRSFVDPDRVAVIGVGTGATAAMLAAGRGESAIPAVIALRPPSNLDEIFYRKIVPPRLALLAPLCHWTFEIGYGVSMKLAELEVPAVRARPTTMVLHHRGAMDDSRLANKVLDHLDRHLRRDVKIDQLPKVTAAN
jgi:hypothetical protein